MWPCILTLSNSVQSLSRVRPMDCSTSGLPVHHQLPEFTQFHVHCVSDAIQSSQPLSFLLFLPSIPPSIRVFSDESTLLMRWPKYWSFSHAACGILVTRPGIKPTPLTMEAWSLNHWATSSVQFSSVAQSCPTLCDPMNCSTPGLPVYHHLLEFTQTHVH